MGVIHRFLKRVCNYRRDLNSSEVLLALRDVNLREGRHVGPFPRGGPLASFQGNILDLMNDTCEDLSVICVQRLCFFNGETTPSHTFLCSVLQCLPPGDPIILCA